MISRAARVDPDWGWTNPWIRLDARASRFLQHRTPRNMRMTQILSPSDLRASPSGTGQAAARRPSPASMRPLLDARGNTDGLLAPFFTDSGERCMEGASPPRIEPDERLDGTAFGRLPIQPTNRRRIQKDTFSKCKR